MLQSIFSHHAVRHGRVLVAIAIASGILGAAELSQAEPVLMDYSLSASPFIYNDRIGNSRFFTGANSDLVRFGANVQPSPDSDFFPLTSGGLQTRSTNGSATTVRLDASRNVGLLPGGNVSLTFVGLESGFGGGRNEYNRAFARSSFSQAMLDAWDVTPLTISVRNPKAADGNTLLTVKTPDFNPSALPAFVTDLVLTGNGLTPKISWVIPPGGVTPSRVSIQIRKIEAESADLKHITKATLLDSRNIPIGTGTYDFSVPFSNANLGFPSKLEVGSKYEISVQLDVVSQGGALNGRSRTFFEFTPLDEGSSGVAVVLPSVGPDGIFKFDVKVAQGQTIALDPVVAIGYDYQIGAGDPLFASVSLPSIGDGLYDLYLFDGLNYVFKQVLQAGQQFFFGGTGVDRFRIMGIEAGAGLDPADATAFITNVTFAGDGRFTGTMTPITLAVADVPEPGALALMFAGLGALVLSRRRWRAMS
ncbi:MAG: hypothetical protein JWP29_2335 [Rhodoferax sp.]|nr:hypothetical protein [Rhodoferax sp.]